MLVVTDTAVRSLWSLLLLLLWLGFLLVGVSIVVKAAMAEELTVDPVALDVTVGLLIVAGGGWGSWRAARQGAFWTPAGLLLRDTRSRLYASSEVESVTVAEEAHTVPPLVAVFPVLVLAGGERVEVRPLAHYALTRRGRARVWRAAGRLASWVDRPLTGDQAG